jgi:hypothetical protein
MEALPRCNQVLLRANDVCGSVAWPTTGGKDPVLGIDASANGWRRAEWEMSLP